MTTSAHVKHPVVHPRSENMVVWGQVLDRSRPVSVMNAKSGRGNLPEVMSVAIAPDWVPPPQLQTSVI